MLHLVERGFFKPTELRLSSQPTAMPGTDNPDVQVLRVGKFNHPKYGEFEITTKILSELKQNFDNKVRGVDLAVDYFHKSDEEAAGWFTELFLSDDTQELWGKVDWTKIARMKFADREIRYFSPDFAFKWTDPESGIAYNNVLFGGGLTNRPFVKDMAAIVAAEEKDMALSLAELEKKVLKLSEDGAGLADKHAALQKAHSDLQAQHSALQKKMAEYDESDDADDADDKSDPAAPPAPPAMAAMKKQLDEVDGRNKALEKELADMKAGKQLAEKKASFGLLLSEGKACAAQEESFLKGDMETFVKLSQPLNLEGKGNAHIPSDPSKEDREDRVLKLAETIASEKKIGLVEAITLANKQLKE